MEELKPLMDMGETVQTYFSAKMSELLKANTAMPIMSTRRNFNGEIVPYVEPDPERYCEHCGHSLDDPDY